MSKQHLLTPFGRAWKAMVKQENQLSLDSTDETGEVFLYEKIWVSPWVAACLNAGVSSAVALGFEGMNLFQCN